MGMSPGSFLNEDLEGEVFSVEFVSLGGSSVVIWGCLSWESMTGGGKSTSMSLEEKKLSLLSS